MLFLFVRQPFTLQSTCYFFVHLCWQFMPNTTFLPIFLPKHSAYSYLYVAFLLIGCFVIEFITRLRGHEMEEEKNATPKPENNNVNLLFARRTVMPFFIAPKALTHLTVKRHGVHCNYFIQVVEQKVEPPLELIYSYSYASKLLTAEFISVSSSELLIIILIFPPKYDKRKFSRSIRLLSANLLWVLFLGKAIILLFGQPNRKCKPHQ